MFELQIEANHLLTYLYPDEVKSGLIRFEEDKEREKVVISHWDVEIPKPSEEEIEELIEENAEQIKVWHNMNIMLMMADGHVKNIIFQTAFNKGYDDVMTICSYANSNNIQWQAEALTFIEWRDEVWKYFFDMEYAIRAGHSTVNTLEDFLNGVPKIVWPE